MPTANPKGNWPFLREAWKSLFDAALVLVMPLFVSIHKRFFGPISALCSKFYPRNINTMPVVKFFVCLDLDQNSSLLDEH